MAKLRSPSVRIKHLSAKARLNTEIMKYINGGGEASLPRASRKGRGVKGVRGTSTSQVAKGISPQRLWESDSTLGDDPVISPDRDMNLRDVSRVIGVLERDSLGIKESTDSAKTAISLLFGLLNDRQVKALEDANSDLNDKFVETCIGEARSMRAISKLSTDDAAERVRREGVGTMAPRQQRRALDEETEWTYNGRGSGGVQHKGAHNGNGGIDQGGQSGWQQQVPRQQQQQQQTSAAGGAHSTGQPHRTAAELKWMKDIDNKRKFNIIIMGAREVRERMDDEASVIEMLNYMGCDRAIQHIVNVTRLGKYRGKNRLIKVDFNHERAARHALDNEDMLRGSDRYKYIYIKRDRNFSERENSQGPGKYQEAAFGASVGDFVGSIREAFDNAGTQRQQSNQLDGDIAATGAVALSTQGTAAGLINEGAVQHPKEEEREVTGGAGIEEGITERDGSKQTTNKDAGATGMAASPAQGPETGAMDGGTLPHHEEGEGDGTGGVSTEEGKTEVDSQANVTENGADATNSAEVIREGNSGNEEGKGVCEKD